MNNIKLDLNKELDLKDIVEQEEKDVFLEVKNFVNQTKMLEKIHKKVLKHAQSAGQSANTSPHLSSPGAENHISNNHSSIKKSPHLSSSNADLSVDLT